MNLKNSDNRLRLYRNGRITTTVNYTIPMRSYYVVETINLGKLNSRRVLINCYGRSTPNNLAPNNKIFTTESQLFYPIEINVSGGTFSLDVGYRLAPPNLYICILNQSTTTDATPVTPYFDAIIDYFVFYY